MTARTMARALHVVIALLVVLAFLVPDGGIAAATSQDGNRTDPVGLRDSIPGPARSGPPTIGGIWLKAPVLDGVRELVPVVDPEAASLNRCSSSPLPTGPQETVTAALYPPVDEGSRARLVALHDSLEAAGAARSHDVETLYLSAVIMGARSEVSSGRDKLRWAEAMYSRALSVLESDPDHAGTRHLVGRLHAAVRRMSGFERFVARSLFGGEVLGAASWDSARLHLEAAEAGAPCVADHHYELARLYADLGERELALREIRHVVRLTLDDADDEPVLRKATSLLVELERDTS